jgi:hypothetical protein
LRQLIQRNAAARCVQYDGIKYSRDFNDRIAKEDLSDKSCHCSLRDVIENGARQIRIISLGSFVGIVFVRRGQILRLLRLDPLFARKAIVDQFVRRLVVPIFGMLISDIRHILKPPP